MSKPRNTPREVKFLTDLWVDVSQVIADLCRAEETGPRSLIVSRVAEARRRLETIKANLAARCSKLP